MAGLHVDHPVPGLPRARAAWRRRRLRALALCALLDKAERRQVNTPIEYCGFIIPDAFVVGYGLDFAQRYRHLPYIAVLEDQVGH